MLLLRNADSDLAVVALVLTGPYSLDNVAAAGLIVVDCNHYMAGAVGEDEVDIAVARTGGSVVLDVAGIHHSTGVAVVVVVVE